MYMYVAVAPHASWPKQKMSRVELNFLQCTVRIFNTVQMQLWQSSTFSKLSIKYSHITCTCMSAVAPHASWPTKNVKG